MARPAGRCGEWGTLEPCLDKTSHSPLVRATSSLIGHLNSSVRKESRGEGGRAETGLVDSRGPQKRTHGRASSLTQGAASWEPVWEVLGQWGRAASRGQPSASREEPGSGLTYSRCGHFSLDNPGPPEPEPERGSHRAARQLGTPAPNTQEKEQQEGL